MLQSLHLRVWSNWNAHHNIIRELLLVFKLEFYSAEKITTGKKQQETEEYISNADFTKVWSSTIWTYLKSHIQVINVYQCLIPLSRDTAVSLAAEHPLNIRLEQQQQNIAWEKLHFLHYFLPIQTFSENSLSTRSNSAFQRTSFELYILLPWLFVYRWCLQQRLSLTQLPSFKIGSLLNRKLGMQKVFPLSRSLQATFGGNSRQAPAQRA